MLHCVHMFALTFFTFLQIKELLSASSSKAHASRGHFLSPISES